MIKPAFSTLIVLTFVSVFLLLPFALSPLYIPALREQAFELYLLLQGDIYKQITGYSSLIFVILEMIFTLRKRGRGWKLPFKIPGDMQFWRKLHIFLGVGLLATTLIHTVGVTGLNFNAIFLWVFFGVTLSALVGVVAETGVLESSNRYFGKPPTKEASGVKGSILQLPTLTKGELIRGLRKVWLTTHILLVSAFLVMLGFHIFLTYYYV
ncbi:MAG: hypothetical protein WBA77_09290 [Microcoleaceae cyanobacterium]